MRGPSAKEETLHQPNVNKTISADEAGTAFVQLICSQCLSFEWITAVMRKHATFMRE
jgi:hypothetical protein